MATFTAYCSLDFCPLLHTTNVLSGETDYAVNDDELCHKSFHSLLRVLLKHKNVAVGCRESGTADVIS